MTLVMLVVLPSREGEIAQRGSTPDAPTSTTGGRGSSPNCRRHTKTTPFFARSVTADRADTESYRVGVDQAPAVTPRPTL